MLNRQCYQSRNNFYHPFSSKNLMVKLIAKENACFEQYQSPFQHVSWQLQYIVTVQCLGYTMYFHLVNDEIFTFAQFNTTPSSISNPLSAITISSGRRLLRKSQFSVKYLSLAHFLQAFYVWLITPRGVKPIENFEVL